MALSLKNQGKNRKRKSCQLTRLINIHLPHNLYTTKPQICQGVNMVLR